MSWLPWALALTVPARLVLWLKTKDSGSTFLLSGKFGASLKVCDHLLTSAKDLGLAVVRTRDWHTLGAGSDSVPRMAREINIALAQDFPEGISIKVIAEPGCFYAASVRTAAVNIITKKAVLEPEGHRKLLYYLNEGHYGVFHYLFKEPVPRTPIMVKELYSEPPLFPCTLYGPMCDALDELSMEEVQLPELDVGNWLVFPSLGSYSSVMSSTFNGFLLASVCYTVGPELRCEGEREGSGALGRSYQNVSLEPTGGSASGPRHDQSGGALTYSPLQ